tara:strand:+ start:593 stop:826 length:234 start_codon:yes stop_codon:yes gene_type:complete
MIERIMAQPIFMFTRVALSALITASAGIMMISFLYLAWTFVEDVYDALTREPIDMTNVDLYSHIQPITVTATKRPID